MSDAYDPDLFRDAAQYYDRYRAPYAPEAIAEVVKTFALDRGCRVLDLGCGPGTLTTPFAKVAGEVVALDPDPGMLDEARRLAKLAGVSNIAWRQAGSKEVGSVAGPLRLVLMGQSFHWMDRDQVLRDLYDQVEDGGGLAVIGPGERRPQESYEEEAARIVERYLGERPPHPQRNPEGRHEPALERSRFQIASYTEYPSVIERDVSAIIGHLYSNSGSTRPQFGDRAEAFERDIREAMLALRPDGVFTEHIETGVLIAMKR